MNRHLRASLFTAIGALSLIFATGCFTPIGIAVQVVGWAVDTEENKQLAKELVGKPVSAADAKFGKPLEIWREVRGRNEWRVYPTGMDLLNNQRHVVQVYGDKIRAVVKVKIDGSGMDLARKFALDDKVLGKTPKECEKALEMGPPMVTARNEKTGLMVQLYDAKMIEGIGSPHYARLRYDAKERCNEIALVDVKATSSETPTR